MDPYETLGVKPDATKDEIKAAYRRKARDTHPDAGGSADLFAMVASAYGLLADDAARAHYDRTGQARRTGDAEREAFQVLARLLTETIGELDSDRIFTVDLVGVLRKDVEKGLSTHRKERKKAVGRVKRLKRIQAKWRSKHTAAPSFAQVALEKMMQREEARKAEADHGIRVGKRMLALLDLESFERAPAEAPASPYRYRSFSDMMQGL